jgi:hypothetical protein
MGRGRIDLILTLKLCAPINSEASQQLSQTSAAVVSHNQSNGISWCPMNVFDPFHLVFR